MKCTEAFTLCPINLFIHSVIEYIISTRYEIRHIIALLAINNALSNYKNSATKYLKVLLLSKRLSINFDMGTFKF